MTQTSQQPDRGIQMDRTDRESRFRIPCGNGQKTFKWLGLVSAARYSSESPKGSLRMRESRQAQAAGTALIPSNITTSDTSFFHPEALLGEQLEDGAERRSRRASPDPRKPFREQAMRDEYSAQEAKRTALEAMEADKRRGTMGAERAHYVQLDELFKTYAASGSSIATAQEIEFNEFTEFVHNANLVAEGPGSQQVMHSCYNEANGDFSGGGRKSRGGPNRKVSAVASFHETKHIERPAFFNALLWFALFWAGHPDGQPDPLSRPGRQLLQLLEEKILPLVHKRLPGALGKIALDQDDVLSLFYDAEEDLRGIFRARANTSDDEITITEFVSVVDDAGLIGRGGAAAASAGGEGGDARALEGSTTLTLKDVRQAFAASQSEVAFAAPGHEKKKKSESSRRDEARDIHTSHSLMSFAEFIEAVARIGLTKWSGGADGVSSVGVAERIQRAIQAIVHHK
ncbi:hypothetical protein JL722_12848 [Aureococcus anophagefferens]|nr:hypothetical protein JL722_12848 [Aureococcus anophagefferens]